MTFTLYNIYQSINKNISCVYNSKIYNSLYNSKNYAPIELKFRYSVATSIKDRFTRFARQFCFWFIIYENKNRPQRHMAGLNYV